MRGRLVLLAFLCSFFMSGAWLLHAQPALWTPVQTAWDALGAVVTALKGGVQGLATRLTTAEKAIQRKRAARLALEAPTPPVPAPPSPAAQLDIGIYYITVEAMPTWKAKGGTVVQEWCSADGSRKGFLDAAQAAGLNVMLEISLLNGGPTTPQGVRDCMRPYKTHPALYGWMVTDEPDVAGHPPAAVLAAYQAAKAEDPAHPIAVTITCEPAAKVNCKEYVNAADAVHVDWYPVNYGLPAADSVARAIRRARRIVPAAKRLNPIIQTFDWKQEFGPPRHNGGKTRPPTWQEVRDMGLAGLREAKNATIIWLYCYCDHKSPAKLPEYNKAVWDNLPAITTAWQAWTSARSGRAP